VADTVIEAARRALLIFSLDQETVIDFQPQTTSDSPPQGSIFKIKEQ
jgi:hypothetical protein